MSRRRMSKRKKPKDDDSFGDSISLSFLLAGAYALETLANGIRFQKFLKKQELSNRRLLPGMKLIFENLIEDQILQIKINSAFLFESDRLTDRAMAIGHQFEVVRSNSVLAKVLRGFDESKKRVLAETTIPDFQAAIREEFSVWFKATKQLFRSHVVVNKTSSEIVSKSALRKLQTYSWYLRFLNIHQNVDVDLSFQLDDNGILEILKQTEYSSDEDKIAHQKDLEREKAEQQKKQKTIDKLLEGWKITAAFLWSAIDSSVVPKPPVDMILQCKSWKDLDALFRPIVDGPIAEVDKKLGTEWGDVFRRKSRYKPRILRSLMCEKNLENEENQHILLDHCLLWHNFEVLDGAMSKIFSGVSTFANLLVGSVQMRERLGWSNKIEIRRFLHPAYKKGEYDISYAILVPSFSSVADYSGWIVSLMCCNNYSGFSGGRRRYAETFIEENFEHLSIEDMHISFEELKKYLRTKVRERAKARFGRSLSESEWESIKLEESIELGVGMSAAIIELVVAVTMAEAGYEIHWQFRDKRYIGNREIDVLAIKEKEVQIIECSKHLPINSQKISSLVKELDRKRELIRNSPLNRPTIITRYVTTKDLREEHFNSTAQILRKGGIIVENVYEILERLPHKTKPVAKLLSDIDFLKLQFG